MNILNKPTWNEDRMFYIFILNNRLSKKNLAKYGVLSTNEAERILARMHNGSSKEDALYAMEQDRKRQ